MMYQELKVLPLILLGSVQISNLIIDGFLFHRDYYWGKHHLALPAKRLYVPNILIKPITINP